MGVARGRIFLEALKPNGARPLKTPRPDRRSRNAFRLRELRTSKLDMGIFSAPRNGEDGSPPCQKRAVGPTMQSCSPHCSARLRWRTRRGASRFLAERVLPINLTQSGHGYPPLGSGQCGDTHLGVGRFRGAVDAIERELTEDGMVASAKPATGCLDQRRPSLPAASVSPTPTAK